MTPDEEERRLLVADDKLEIAAAMLQRFVANGSPESYRQLAAIQLDVRHAMAAVRDILKARGLLR